MLPVREIEAALLESAAGTQARFALGAPRHGRAGFQETHALARAAYRVAAKSEQRLTRCLDVAPAAALLADRALAGLMIESYLAPLESMRMGGELARRTLSAYCRCEGNASSAAHLLGISRRTLQYRLQAIATRLGAPPRPLLPGLAVALQVEAALGREGAPGAAPASGGRS